MEWRGFARSAVLLFVVVALVLTLPSTPGARQALEILDEGSGGYGLTELPHVLPEGILELSGAGVWQEEVLLTGLGTSGNAFLARYDPLADRLGPRVEMPAHIASIDQVTIGSQYAVLVGKSVGTSPVLGVYEFQGKTFHEVSAPLPASGEAVTLLQGGPPHILVTHQDGSPRLSVLDPGTRTLQALPPLENVTAIRHGLWNGTALYLAGVRPTGEPALLILDASGNPLRDLSPALPGDMAVIDALVGSANHLFVIGHRGFSVTTRASLAAYDTATWASEALTGGLGADILGIPFGVWNGTALILQARTLILPKLVVYTPAERSFTIIEENGLHGRELRTMLAVGGRLLFVGRGESPSVGLLETASWEWQERTALFEGPYLAIHGTASVGDRLLMAGQRRTSAALGFLDPARGALEDVSDQIGLPNVVIYDLAVSGEIVFLVGVQEGQGVFYGLNATSRSWANFTKVLPRPGEAFHSIARNGPNNVLLGRDPGGVLVFLQNGEANTTWDLSAEARRYFEWIERAIAVPSGFALVGQNRQGPALAMLNPGPADLTYVGEPLGDLYGASAAFLAGDGDGGNVLLGGGWGSHDAALGLWTPATRTYRDLSAQLPAQFGRVTQILWADQVYVIVAQNQTGPRLAAYYPENRSLVDLSSLLPPGATQIDAVGRVDTGVFLVTRSGASPSKISALTLKRGSFLDLLPSVFRDPVSATVLGLVVLLVASLAFSAGRRKGAKMPEIPPPPDLPEIDLEPMEPYGWDIPPRYPPPRPPRFP